MTTTPSRSSIVWSAALTTAVAVVLSWLLLAPVHRAHGEVAWTPRTASDNGVPVVLAAEVPERLDAQVPCAAYNSAPPVVGTETVLSTSKNPNSLRLLVLTDGSTMWVNLGGQDVEGLSLGIPRPAPPGCLLGIRYTRQDNTITLSNGVASISRTAVWRSPFDRSTTQEGVVVTGLETAARLVPGIRAAVTTQPTVVEFSLARAATTALALALLAAVGALMLWPWIGGTRSRRRGVRVWTRSDTAAAVGILVMIVVIPPQYDDGWVLTSVRGLPELGYSSNYYQNEAAPQPMGLWWVWIQHFWLGQTGLPALGLRLVPAVLLMATWLVLRRLIVNNVLPTAGRRRTQMMALAAFIFLASSWLVTLRAETAIALLLALQIAVVGRSGPRIGLDTAVISGLLCALAISLHQTGVVVLLAATALLPGVLQTVRVHGRRFGAAMLVITLASALTAAVLLTLNTDLATWISGSQAFTSDRSYEGFLNEIARISALSGDFVPPMRRFSVVLALVGLLGFLTRPRGFLSRSAEMVGFSSILSILGITLTLSKWPWHYGALLPAAVLLVTLTFHYLINAEPTPFRPLRGVVIVLTLAAGGYWSAQAVPNWSLSGTASLSVEDYRGLLDWGQPSLSSLLWWAAAAAVGTVLVSVRPDRAWPMVGPVSAMAAATAIQSLAPLFVDLVVSGSASWIGQTTAIASGNACGSGGATGVRIATETTVLESTAEQQAGGTPARLRLDSPSEQDPAPVLDVQVYVRPEGSRDRETIVTPWQRLPAGVPGAAWVLTDPGITRVTFESAAVGSTAISSRPSEGPTSLPMWRLVEVPASAQDTAVRLSWTAAGAGVRAATAFVSIASTASLNELTATSWVNPGTYLLTPCLSPPSIASGVLPDVQWLAGTQEALWYQARGFAYEGRLVELGCQGDIGWTSRFCAIGVRWPKPSLPVTVVAPGTS